MKRIGKGLYSHIFNNTPAEWVIEGFVFVKYGYRCLDLDKQDKDLRLSWILQRDCEDIQALIGKKFNVLLPLEKIKSAENLVLLDRAVLDAIMRKEQGAIRKSCPHRKELHAWFLISQLRLRMMEKFPGRYISPITALYPNDSPEWIMCLEDLTNEFLSYMPMTKAGGKDENKSSILTLRCSVAEEIYYGNSVLVLTSLIMKLRPGIEDLIIKHYNLPMQKKLDFYEEMLNHYHE